MKNKIQHNRGSEWRKWDLHIHAPSKYTCAKNDQFVGTSLEDKQGNFIKELKTLQNVSVLGITDYFSLDGYKKVIESKDDLKNIDLILPNIELRITPVTGSDRKINLHIIENTKKLTTDEIERFLYKFEFSSEKFTCVRNDLITLGKKDDSGLSDEEAFKIGLNKFHISYDKFFEKLNEQSKKFKDNILIGVSNNSTDGASGIKDVNGIRDIIYEGVDFIFSSQPSDREYFLGKAIDSVEEIVTKYNSLKPCIHGSDYHGGTSGKEICIPDLNRFCWIKTCPTFEGLKQITYEPEIRIFIGEEKPKKPINTIDSITLKIPSDAKVGEDEFCFVGNNNSYSLSPYFNCFIGGRGSGKSTILNFLGLHSNNPDEPNNFWNELNPNFNSNDDNIFSFDGTEVFEFLAQSEIESFARDKSKFTQAIYDRANGSSKVLQVFEDSIDKYKIDLDKIIKAISDLQELALQKRIKEKEKRSLENTKNIIESEDYKKLTDSISELTQKIQVHKKWSSEVDIFKTLLSEFIEFHSKVLDGNNDKIKYKDSFLLSINKAKEAVDLLENENFDEVKKEEKSHQDNLLLLEEELKNLLNKGSFSEDNIEQIKSAPQKIVALEREIEQINFQMEGRNKIITTLDNIVIELKSEKENYEQKIQAIVNPLQELLEKQFEENKGKDIKKISLEYSFDEKSAWISLSEEFYNLFYSKYHDSERSKEVCEFIVKNQKTFITNTFDEIKKLVQQSQKGDTQYIKFVDEVFKDDRNFKIFQAIRDKHLYDVKLNKIIQVKYDNRDVEQASFGQRCTAVVVILLLFGNYPLIIDEPEAHLDSSLIANYLVPLLKEKKSDRQIIFATHNANFVINGDAEKIFILKNETGQTEIIETTIEDTTNREELLKLEGGKEAFKKRGEKLNIE